MKKVNGFWLPSSDTYFIDKPNYEIKETGMVLRVVDKFRTAIDVGAHCGYWSQRLSKIFENVLAIEPVDEHFACLEKNTEGLKNVKNINAAASNFHGTVNLEVSSDNSGMSKVVGTDLELPSSSQNIKTVIIDDFDLNDIDFIKIDVEGYEKNVLRGCLKTLKRCKPVLLVEINNNYNDVASLLTPLGYHMVLKNKYNYIWKYKRGG